MKPIRILAVFAAVCLLTGPTATLEGAPAAQAAPAAAPAPISWLAAGDSYSSGEGLPHSKGKCAQAEPGSGSTTWAYQAYLDLHATHPNVTAPTLVACTGAVTSDLINANDGEGHPEWSPSMGTYDLVTFTFGGNNVGFASFLEQCIGLSRLVATIENGPLTMSGDVGRIPHFVAPLPSDPGHTSPANSIMRQRIKALGAAYRKFLTEVADKVVARGGNIVVLGYPQFVELPKYWNWWEKQIGGCWGIGIGDATEIRGLAGDLNATIAQAVTAINAQTPNGVHVRYVDVNTGNPAQGIAYTDPHLFEPSAGPRHNLCAAQEWLNGWTHIDGGYGSFHPNQHGLDNEAALAAQAISDLDWSHLVNPDPLLGRPSAPQTTTPNYTVQLSTIAPDQGGSIQDSYNGSSFSYAVSTSDDSQSDAPCGCTPPVSPATETLASMQSTSCSSISLRIFVPWNPADTGGQDEVSLVQSGEPTSAVTVTTDTIEADLNATLTGGPWTLDVTETAPAADGHQATVYIAGTLSCSTSDGTESSSSHSSAGPSVSPSSVSQTASTGGTSIASAPVLDLGRSYAVNLLDGPTAQLSAPGETQQGGICPMWAGQWWKLNLRSGDAVSVSWSYNYPASGYYQYLVFSPSTTDQDVMEQANNGGQLQFTNSDAASGSGSFTAPATGSYPFIIGDGCPSTSGPFRFIVRVISST